MGKVFTPPKEIKVPEFDWKDREKGEAAEAQFMKDLADYCKNRNPNEKYAGELIEFQVGDGYAQYMIASLKPVQLVHIPLGDSWEFRYVTKLSKTDIIKQIEAEKAFNKIFQK